MLRSIQPKGRSPSVQEAGKARQYTGGAVQSGTKAGRVSMSLFAGTCSADTKDLSDFDKKISKLIQDARNNYNDTSFECKQDELYPPYRDQN
jgi:hypothetical protein